MDIRAVSKPLSALALLLGATAALACSADIPGNGTPGAGGGMVGGGGGSAPNGTGGGVPNGTAGGTPVTPAECLTPPPPTAPLRRLTRFEYNNTVRDLVKVTDWPADAFPSEESGNGFGNDAKAESVSSVLAKKYVATAETLAQTLTAPAQIATLAPCAAAPDAANEAACVRTVIDSFVPKAYRRPLEAGEADGLLQLFQTVRTSGATFVSSLAGVLEAVLQGPEFLYRPEFGEPVAGRTDVLRPTSSEMATRLSYLFWGTLPDDALRTAAASGQLQTNEGVKTQAARLLADPKSRSVLRYFFDQLLPIAGLASLERNPAEYPTFNGRIGGLMRQETQTFLENEIFSGPGTWPGVFTAPYTYVNQELATFYGITGVTGETFQKVALDPSKRTGLLTQGGIVAGPIHSNENNPVTRGSFVVSKLLCTTIASPPASLGTITPPSPDLGGTTRDRYTEHSKNPQCKGCHVNMDPIGFALEKFDAVGLYRDKEDGLDINVQGDSPALGTFNGAIELGQRLAESEQAQQCFATHWVNFGYGRTAGASDACSVLVAQEQFKAANYNIKELLLGLTQTANFLYLPAVRE